MKTVFYLFIYIFFCTGTYAQTDKNFSIIIIDETNSFDTLFLGEAYFEKGYKSSSLVQNFSKHVGHTFSFRGIVSYPTAFRVSAEKGIIQFNELIFLDTGCQYFKIRLVNNKIIIEDSLGSSVQKEYRKLLENSNKMNTKVLYDYIKKNKNSYVALFFMIDQVFNNGFNNEWRKISICLSDSLKKSKAFTYFSTEYLEPKKIEILELKNTFGNNLKLDFKLKSRNDKLVILFWFASCKPCIAELISINKRFPYKGFKIISVCIDSFSINSKAHKLIEKNKIMIPNYWDCNGNKFRSYINLIKYPTNIVINSDGFIVSKDENISKLIKAKPIN